MNTREAPKTRVLRLVGAWLALLALLALTFGLAHLHLGAGNLAAALAIAALKTAVIGWFFMGLRTASMLLRAVCITGLAALALLGGLSASDFVPRVNEAVPWQVPQTVAPRLQRPQDMPSNSAPKD